MLYVNLTPFARDIDENLSPGCGGDEFTCLLTSLGNKYLAMFVSNLLKCLEQTHIVV